ncbi:uncharacterized protein GGS22DRAFT_188848 [Annulohypoxylon maeteangense]|uniref:uncharacterized protein n=1 Tax=Annulohypoxylon maeteangense TaxID=1927788 RepID=UPI0020071F68|nr:uncharacterized protein GGS22DRAFT_188848 [Annulohypoxylon maeteangense]KAI0884638.1 hypothetical protein GGS22DRAFT_188848 [Annulohypoxylon maeteangense]
MASSKTPAVISAGVVLITITTLAMSSRMAARWMYKTMGFDDVLISISWLLSLALCICVMVAMRYGLGYHHDTINPEDYKIFLKIQIACSVTYSWGVQAAKASFAVLYLRIFPEGDFRIVNKVLLVFVFLQAIEETCVVVFRCHPVQKSWDPQLEGSCLDLHPLWYSTFVFNLITDLILFIEPIPSTWKLQLPTSKKLGFISMLSLGLLVTVISVIRIVYATGISTDDTFELVNPLIWSTVEICALIICSSIPSVKQVAVKIPVLNHLLGISSLGESFGPSRKKRNSIPLDSRGHGDYIKSKSQKSRTLSIQRSNPFGMTSHVTAAAVEDTISESGSQDEIFPNKIDKNGVIRVTTEVQHNVESGSDSARHFSNLTSQHRHELKSIVERQRSNHASPTKENSCDKKWLRRSG